MSWLLSHENIENEYGHGCWNVKTENHKGPGYRKARIKRTSTEMCENTMIWMWIEICSSTVWYLLNLEPGVNCDVGQIKLPSSGTVAKPGPLD